MFKRIKKLQKISLIIFFDLFILLNFEVVDNQSICITTFILLNIIYILCNLETFKQIVFPTYIPTIEETIEYRQFCGKNLEKTISDSSYIFLFLMSDSKSTESNKYTYK